MFPIPLRVHGESAMAETILCGYCVDLPEKGPAGAAEVSRCPLCKSELGVSRSGERFRIGASLAPRRRRWSLLIVPALAGAAACTVGAVWMLLPPAEPVETVVLPPPPAPMVEPAQRIADSTAEQPHPHAALKPYCEGAQTVVARAKAPTPEGAEVTPAPILADRTSAKAVTEAAAGERKRNTPRYATLTEAKETEAIELQGQKELAAAREIELEKRPAAKEPQKVAKKERDEARERIAAQARDIRKKNAEQPDGFIVGVIKERPDLAGLPFLLGKACQLSPSEAAQLAFTSRAIRGALAQSA